MLTYLCIFVCSKSALQIYINRSFFPNNLLARLPANTKEIKFWLQDFCPPFLLLIIFPLSLLRTPSFFLLDTPSKTLVAQKYCTCFLSKIFRTANNKTVKVTNRLRLRLVCSYKLQEHLTGSNQRSTWFCFLSYSTCSIMKLEQASHKCSVQSTTNFQQYAGNYPGTFLF